jgi:hypothetical protein
MAAQNKIREIGQILNASARANKYRVSFTWPNGVSGATSLPEVDVLAKSATAPEKEIGMIELWNQGRKHIIPGDTAFSNAWSLDFYLDESHKLRIDMLKWQSACDNFHKNLHSGLPFEIFTDLKIEQLDSAGNISAKYTLHNAWPQVVGEVAYGDDSADTPGEFNCTFAFTDWVIGDGDVDNYIPMKPTHNATGL